MNLQELQKWGQEGFGQEDFTLILFEMLKVFVEIREIMEAKYD